MIEGVLTVNLDPPYLQFHGDNRSVDGCLRECTTEELRAALGELAECSIMHWPLQDCVIRLRGMFPIVKLSLFGLLRGRLVGIQEHLLLRSSN